MSTSKSTHCSLRGKTLIDTDISGPGLSSGLKALVHLNPERHFGEITTVDHRPVFDTWSVIQAGCGNRGLHQSLWFSVSHYSNVNARNCILSQLLYRLHYWIIFLPSIFFILVPSSVIKVNLQLILGEGNTL